MQHSENNTDGAWKLPALAAAAPFCLFLFGHQKGMTIKMFDAAYRWFGAAGLIGLPMVTLSIEKCLYDTMNCYQGSDPNAKPEGGGGGFPSGGSTLPSLSLIPVNPKGLYYKPPLRPSEAASE
ncbi:hypothetical protein DIPPA_55002 [Diplonema papillatum]|nr:hypothetical protein DIPPA_55002 [Diplonema papillatum]